MENDNMMELVESIVRDRIKQRDGYKLTGAALGTLLINSIEGLLASGHTNRFERFELGSFYNTLAICGIYIFLGSLINNIVKLYKYRKESIIGRLNQVLEMIVAIFYSCVASMLLWHSFFTYFSMSYFN